MNLFNVPNPISFTPPTMRRPFRAGCLALAALTGWLLAARPMQAADFNVTSPGSFYNISGLSPNPTLTLVRGETYTFAVSTAAGHPFQIIAAGATILNNNISSGTITFTVPTNAANYRYRCSIHGFGGNINTVPPPEIRIVSLERGASSVVLRSTGTNNWRLTPEFSTNLATTNWFELTVQTNRFSNGTNETICGVPPGSNAFLRLRAQRL